MVIIGGGVYIIKLSKTTFINSFFLSLAQKQWLLSCFLKPINVVKNYFVTQLICFQKKNITMKN